MSAGQLAFDFSPILRAPLRPYAKLLWIHIVANGGSVDDQTRGEIAAALDCDEKTVTNSAYELEAGGWATGSNRGQGHPKSYRCSEKSLSNNGKVAFQERENFPSSTQKGKNSTPAEGEMFSSGDLFETAPVAAQRTDKAGAAPPDATADGLRKGVRPETRASIIDGSRSSLDVDVSNRIVQRGDPNQNRPMKPNPKPRARPELRARHTTQNLELLEGKLTELFGKPEGLPPLGTEGDQIAAVLLTYTAASHWTVGQLLRELDRVWQNRRDGHGELKPGLQRMDGWGYVVRAIQRALPAKIPPAREMEHAEPRDGPITDAESQATVDMLMGRKAGGASG